MNRTCQTCGTSAYDYDWNVVRRLPIELQHELDWQNTSATKGASLLLSRDLEHLMEFTFTNNMGAAGWETCLERSQSTAYAKRLRAWLHHLKKIQAKGLEVSQPNFTFPTMSEMSIIHVNS